MSANLPPRALVSWTATALGANFGGYRVYRRPARNPVVSWSLIGKLDVPTGYSAATVEAQHTQFLDYEAGWSFTGGQWASGWDYSVTVLNASTGTETPKTVNAAGVTLTPDNSYWAVSNVSPFLNFPLQSVPEWSTADDSSSVWRGRAAGRDTAIVRVGAEAPARTATFTWKDFLRIGEDPGRLWRAAQIGGTPFTLHSVRGDRVIGQLLPPRNADHDSGGVVQYAGELVESIRDPNYVSAQYNLPCGLVLNGTTQTVTSPDVVALNPAGAFTVLIAGIFPNPAAVVAYLSKAGVSAAGYAIFHDNGGGANDVRFRVQGASATATAQTTDATLFDGQFHVLIGVSTGSAQALYRDPVLSSSGTVTPIASASTVTGAVTNATSFAVGSQGGTSNFSAMAPAITWGFWNRALSAAEIAAAAGDALAYPGFRMPPGSAYFVDLRDTRAWNGLSSSIISDLSGNGLSSSMVASPVTRGIPWNAALLDRF